MTLHDSRYTITDASVPTRNERKENRKQIFEENTSFARSRPSSLPESSRKSRENTPSDQRTRAPKQSTATESPRAAAARKAQRSSTPSNTSARLRAQFNRTRKARLSIASPP